MADVTMTVIATNDDYRLCYTTLLYDYDASTTAFASTLKLLLLRQHYTTVLLQQW